MMRLLVLVALGVIVFRMFMGRWPWQPKTSPRITSARQARKLLGVDERAERADIIAAHKRLLSTVHPDRGGSNEQVHEANDARDLLIDQLPGGADNQEPK